jgi:hypothetical protein
MKQMASPGWKNKSGYYIIEREEWRAEIYPSSNNYAWRLDRAGYTRFSGEDNNLEEIKRNLELILGYRFLVKEEIVIDKYCTCGGCARFTGRWQVLDCMGEEEPIFQSEDDALAWIANQDMKHEIANLAHKMQ